MMTSLRFVTGLTLLTSLLLLTQSQVTLEGSCNGCEGACCSNFVMDNPRLEVIDINTTVDPGVYYGVALKLCADKKHFTIGLWEPDSSSFDLMVLRFTDSYPGVSNAWKKITFKGESYAAINFTTPWNVTRRMYFGVMGMDDIIPIPYDTRPAQASTPRHSIQLGNLYNGQAPGVRQPGRSMVQIEPFSWPRSFSDFVFFCGSPGCLDEAQCVGCRGPRGFRGPPGPPGPPGPSGSPQFVGCDDPEGINTRINDIQSRADQILTIISKVDTDVNNLGKGDRDTGICPVNYISGPYKLGYCYFMWTSQIKTFGEGAIDCAVTTDSHLLDIDTATENAWLAETIAANIPDGMTNLTFYTSGLYSTRYDTWVWYSDQALPRKTLSYENWAAGESQGFEKKRICLVFQVFRDKTTRWISSNCNERRGYICKKMKKCY